MPSLQEFFRSIDFYTRAINKIPDAKVYTNRSLVRILVPFPKTDLPIPPTTMPTIPPSLLSHPLFSIFPSNHTQAYFRTGQYPESLSDAINALSMDPNNGKAHYRAALSSLMLYQPAEALNHLRQMTPDNNDKTTTTTTTTSALIQHASIAMNIISPHHHQQEQEEEQKHQHHVQLVQQLLQVLEDDLDGAADADIEDAMQQLISPLSASSAACAWFRNNNGFQLIMSHFNGPFLNHVVDILKAASSSSSSSSSSSPVIWPFHIVLRPLISLIAPQSISSSSSSSSSLSRHLTAALELITWAAQRDLWVRHFTLTHPLPYSPQQQQSSYVKGNIPLVAILNALKVRSDNSADGQWDTEAIYAVTELLASYTSLPYTKEGCQVLDNLKCQPLGILLHCFNKLDALNGDEAYEKAFGGGGFNTAANDATTDESSNEGQGDDFYPYNHSSSTPNGTSNDSRHPNNGKQASSTRSPDPEAMALAALQQKRKAVIDEDIIAKQRLLLLAFLNLVSIREHSSLLIISECLITTGNTSDTNKATNNSKSTRQGPLIPALLAIIEKLHQRAPKRTAAVLGPDGAAVSYVKRPFAADFRDNPAGDYLALLNLQENDDDNNNNNKNNNKTVAGVTIVNGKSEEKRTLLELVLDALLAIAKQAPPTIGTLLYKRDVLAFCETKLAMYTTPSIISRGQQITAAIADKCPAALDDILTSPAIHSVHALIALAHYSQQQQQQQQLQGNRTTIHKALYRLVSAGVVNNCSGDDFSHLVEFCGYLWETYDLSINETGAFYQTALSLVKECCLRAQQQVQGLRGHVWRRVIGPAAVSRLLATPVKAVSSLPEKKKKKDNANAVAASIEGQQMKKGWLDGKSTSLFNGTVISNERAKENAALPTTTKEDVTVYPNGVTIEEITEEENNNNNNDDDDADDAYEAAIEDLKTVFDSSTAIPKHIKTARNDWLRTTSSSSPESQLLFRWTQTSTDISAWVTLPIGTRAKELSVTITPTALSVSLGWYGTLLAGQLHQRLKSSDCQWCLEDNELHLLLVKDGKDTWWKSLFSQNISEGGDSNGTHSISNIDGSNVSSNSSSRSSRQEQERSYHALLKEAVEADEPVVPYDEMSDEAKELLERLLDRQAMVNEGYIDIENGFDDFRVVIGEKSLGGGSGEQL